MNLNNEDSAVVTCIVEVTKLNLSGLRMKCPHCLTTIYYSPTWKYITSGENVHWYTQADSCPQCEKQIIHLEQRDYGVFDQSRLLKSTLIYPKGISRAPLSEEVPDELAKDYKEACLVLNDSPKASAALSRRCLQHLLWEKAKIKKANLFQEIDEVLVSKILPSHLAEGLHAVRELGNFAAHPAKNTNTGEIVEVEDGEAEWLLDILEGLFDFYFVQPALLQKKKDALNQKLIDAGKKPIK